MENTFRKAAQKPSAPSPTAIFGAVSDSAGSFTDDLIERAAVVELLPEGEHFGIELVVRWNVWALCRTLA